MKRVSILLALVFLPVGAAAQDIEYKGRSLAEWKERTTTDFGLTYRLEAIYSLREMGRSLSRRSLRGDKALAQIADEIVPTLIGLLKDRDPSIRQQAARAFSAFNRKASQKAIPALIELLADENEATRGSAAGALCWRGTDAEPAIPALTKALKETTSRDGRDAIVLALRTAGPKGVETLLAMLDDRRAEIRLAVIGAFVFSYSPGETHDLLLKAVPKFAERLHDDDSKIRESAAVALGSLHGVPASAVDAILTHKDANVRHAGAEALLTRNDAGQFRAELLKLMQGDIDFSRRNASQLSRVGPDSIPVLIKLLDDKDPTVRGGAAESLGKLGPAAKDAAPALKRLLSDMEEVPHADLDQRVCHSAGLALSEIFHDRKYLEGLPPKRPDGR